MRMLIAATLTVALTACVGAPHPVATSHRGPPAGSVDEVRATELAFAKSMADRNFDAFVAHLSRDAVFFDERAVLRGADEVALTWKPLFKSPKAPFSWAPDAVEVLASGNLALSTGPVIVDGKVVGRFNSIWRLESPHTWRIVFDKGETVCPAPSH